MLQSVPAKMDKTAPEEMYQLLGQQKLSLAGGGLTLLVPTTIAKLTALRMLRERVGRTIVHRLSQVALTVVLAARLKLTLRSRAVMQTE